MKSHKDKAIPPDSKGETENDVQLPILGCRSLKTFSTVGGIILSLQLFILACEYSNLLGIQSSHTLYSTGIFHHSVTFPYTSLLLPCRQFVPRQPQITIDFASIEGAVYDVKPSHDTSSTVQKNSSCQE